MASAGQNKETQPKPTKPCGPLDTGSGESVFRFDGLNNLGFTWVKPVGLGLNLWTR